MARSEARAIGSGMGRALVFAEAIRFEKAFWVSADTLMRMQSAYALAEARAREDEIVVAAD